MLAALSLSAGLALGAELADDYLHASGNKLYDVSGNEVRLTGIAWFGFETEQQVYHGLWSVNMEGVLDTVANRGFNLLRIPLSVELVNQWRAGSGGTPGSVNYSANPALQGLSSLQILDASLAYAKRIGLKVMLDMHRVINTQQKEGWYTTGHPAEEFEAGWRWLAERYKNDDTVIAVDLFNEPHGGPGNAAMIKWDASTDANNWKYEATKVANQILDINPRLLIVVQGIEATPKDGYSYADTNGGNYHWTWWGGNLRGVKNTPIDLGSRQSQLVYSPHDYGPSISAQPWFHAGFTEASLTAECWAPNWLYIATQNIAPILVGEWGGKLDGGDNQKWLGFLAHTIATNSLNHTFWVVNPNSGDTGGILLDDWTSVDNAKYGLVKPTLWQDASGKFIGLDHAVNLGANGTHVGAGGTTPPPPDSGGSTVPLTGVALTPTQLALNGAATGQLNAAFVPANATNTVVTWSSSNPSVATVNASGLVTAIGNGTATITVTASAQSGSFSATSAITVTGFGGSIPAGCNAPVAVALPLVLNGAGDFCRVTSGTISNVNSWNTQSVEINGVAFTNAWSATMPARINGNYYIRYVGQYAWSHLEVNGSGGGSGGSGSQPATCSGACNAATPVPPTLSSDGGLGNVTMYSTAPSAGGACNYGSTNVKYYAAINVNINSGDGKGQWQGGRACGQCAEVTALTSQGPQKVVVRIMDKCPDGNCGIDLGGSAPGAVMLDGAGRYSGQWRFVACDGHPEVSDGAPTLEVVSGSNAWWSRLRVRNPLTGVSAIEWRNEATSAQGSFPYATSPENAYEVPTASVLQANTAAFTVTVRYVDGRSATVRLSPAQLGTSGASYPLS
jgi:aryl-phospho-beta-D-glucosidase BglC (GH1 family)